MPQLYLVRHGLTDENAAHILQGHLPGHLSAEGRKQVEALREALAAVRFDALLCSDLQRCIDTAAILNARRNLPTVYTPLLRERDWGPFTGMNILKARTLIDDRAETTDQLFRRAAEFLSKASKRFPDGCLLVVSHGLFCRVIQALCAGKTIRDIPRMANAEARVISAEPPFRLPAPSSSAPVSDA